MPEMQITYGEHSFTWEATLEEAQLLLDSQREAAAKLGDPDAVLNELVMRLPQTLARVDPI